MSSPIIVAGIDVGGTAKGFHAVALRGGAYLGKFNSCDSWKVAEWCREIDVQYIGIDAPCHWSSDGHARAAECKLMKEKIWCFSTPTREKAEKHPKDNFRWMLNGAELYAVLESTHPLSDDNHAQIPTHACFETFPQAIACALAGKIVSAKKKSSVRRDLLKRANIDTSKLNNIDQLDAALCALTAQLFALGKVVRYGDPVDGFIVAPRDSLT